MKKFLLLTVLTFSIILSFACKNRSNNTFSYEQAIANGYIIRENSVTTLGKEKWNDFLTKTQAGEKTTVKTAIFFSRIEYVHCHSLMQLQEHTNASHWGYEELCFDGEKYTVTALHLKEKKSIEFRYLVQFDIKDVENSEDFETFECAYLVNRELSYQAIAEFLQMYRWSSICDFYPVYENVKLKAKMEKSEEEQIRNDYFSLLAKEESFSCAAEIPLHFYGNYNGAYVILIGRESEIKNSFEVDQFPQISIYYPSDQKIKVYKGGDFYSMEQAYKNGLLTIEDIRSVKLRQLYPVECN